MNYYNKIKSVRKLREKIKSKEYEKLSNDALEKINNNIEPNMIELIPDPILIPSNGINKNELKENVLKKIIN